VQNLSRDVHDALSQVEPLSSRLRQADASQWKADKVGKIDLPRMQHDPGWRAVFEIDGLVSLLLARFELALQQAAQHKDFEKSMKRFLSHMEGCGGKDGYFTEGSLAAGVVDMGVDVGLVTPTEAAVLKQKRPWRSSPFYLKDCSDYVELIVSNVRSVMERVDAIHP
jgi:hypothetical protein